MKQNRLAGAMVGVALLWLASGAWAQVTISNLVVAQRPGTKLVDITYDVSSSVTSVYVSLSVSNAGMGISVVNLTGDVGNVGMGTGKSIVWNMGADWTGTFALLSFTLKAEERIYMVIDLSSGPSATSYPVSYLEAVPAGGWSDEYKTTKLVLRRIPAGSFTMGSPTNEFRRGDDEIQHSVTLTKDFYIGLFEITQKQWERVKGAWVGFFFNASYRDSRPVEMVAYTDIRGSASGSGWPANGNVDAASFMGILRAKTGQVFDLPTESQWEYAGRAETTTALNSGYNLTDARLSEIGRWFGNGGANYDANGDTSQASAKVGSYLPNAWGLYDIHGNVGEWCLDWYGTYPGTVSDPKGATSGSDRVIRGGSWNESSGNCRSAARDLGYSNLRSYNTGFRAVAPFPGH